MQGFHLLFKSLAILVYVFSGLFTSNFIFVCVVCILLLAFDFWTVKNVTGRYLVGLRWWNYVKEDGTNEWIFESLENMEDISPSDSRVFWWGLYAPVLIWGAILVIDVLKLEIQWLIVVRHPSLSSATASPHHLPPAFPPPPLAGDHRAVHARREHRGLHEMQPGREEAYR